MQEKHHNELIIRNISRQKEQRRGNMELHFMVREHVMADEIRKRAAMLAAQMGTSGHSARKQFGLLRVNMYMRVGQDISFVGACTCTVYMK